jgi:hypothetical protein
MDDNVERGLGLGVKKKAELHIAASIQHTTQHTWSLKPMRQDREIGTRCARTSHHSQD